MQDSHPLYKELEQRFPNIVPIFQAPQGILAWAHDDERSQLIRLVLPAPHDQAAICDQLEAYLEAQETIDDPALLWAKSTLGDGLPGLVYDVGTNPTTLSEFAQQRDNWTPRKLLGWLVPTARALQLLYKERRVHGAIAPISLLVEEIQGQSIVRLFDVELWEALKPLYAREVIGAGPSPRRRNPPNHASDVRAFGHTLLWLHAVAGNDAWPDELLALATRCVRKRPIRATTILSELERVLIEWDGLGNKAVAKDHGPFSRLSGAYFGTVVRDSGVRDALAASQKTTELTDDNPPPKDNQQETRPLAPIPGKEKTSKSTPEEAVKEEDDKKTAPLHKVETEAPQVPDLDDGWSLDSVEIDLDDDEVDDADGAAKEPDNTDKAFVDSDKANQAEDESDEVDAEEADEDAEEADEDAEEADEDAEEADEDAEEADEDAEEADEDAEEADEDAEEADEDAEDAEELDEADEADEDSDEADKALPPAAPEGPPPPKNDSPNIELDPELTAPFEYGEVDLPAPTRSPEPVEEVQHQEHVLCPDFQFEEEDIEEGIDKRIYIGMGLIILALLLLLLLLLTSSNVGHSPPERSSPDSPQQELNQEVLASPFELALPVEAIAIDSTGSALATCNDELGFVYLDGSKRPSRRFFPLEGCQQLALAPKGLSLAYLTPFGSLYQWQHGAPHQLIHDAHSSETVQEIFYSQSTLHLLLENPQGQRRLISSSSPEALAIPPEAKICQHQSRYFGWLQQDQLLLQDLHTGAKVSGKLPKDHDLEHCAISDWGDIALAFDDQLLLSALHKQDWQQLTTPAPISSIKPQQRLLLLKLAVADLHQYQVRSIRSGAVEANLKIEQYSQDFRLYNQKLYFASPGGLLIAGEPAQAPPENAPKLLTAATFTDPSHLLTLRENADESLFTWWQIASNRPIAEQHIQGNPTHLSLSPTGALAVCQEGKGLWVYDHKGTLIGSETLDERKVKGLRFKGERILIEREHLSSLLFGYSDNGLELLAHLQECTALQGDWLVRLRDGKAQAFDFDFDKHSTSLFEYEDLRWLNELWCDATPHSVYFDFDNGVSSWTPDGPVIRFEMPVDSDMVKALSPCGDLVYGEHLLTQDWALHKLPSITKKGLASLSWSADGHFLQRYGDGKMELIGAHGQTIAFTQNLYPWLHHPFTGMRIANAQGYLRPSGSGVVLRSWKGQRSFLAAPLELPVGHAPKLTPKPFTCNPEALPKADYQSVLEVRIHTSPSNAQLSYLSAGQLQPLGRSPLLAELAPGGTLRAELEGYLPHELALNDQRELHLKLIDLRSARELELSSIKGPLSKAAWGAALSEHRESLDLCAAPAGFFNWERTARFEIIVGSKGDIRRIDAIVATHAELNCISETIEDWQFSKHPTGSVIQYSLLRKSDEI